MADPDTTLHSGTETQSGTSIPFGIPNNQIVGVFVNVSAVTGILPLLTVTVQQSPNGTDWYDIPNSSGILSLANMNTVGLYSVFPPTGSTCCDDVQCVWTISGDKTTSFTFTVDLITY